MFIIQKGNAFQYYSVGPYHAHFQVYSLIVWLDWNIFICMIYGSKNFLVYLTLGVAPEFSRCLKQAILALFSLCSDHGTALAITALAQMAVCGRV